MTKFKIIDETDLEDYSKAIRGAGFAPADFEIRESADPLPSLGIWPEAGTVTVTVTVTVRNKRTGVEHTYRVGHGTIWPADFEQQLKAGVFEFLRMKERQSRSQS